MEELMGQMMVEDPILFLKLRSSENLDVIHSERQMLLTEMSPVNDSRVRQISVWMVELKEKLNEIAGVLPPLSSRTATLKNRLSLLWAIIRWLPRRGTERDLLDRFRSFMERFSFISKSERSPYIYEAALERFTLFTLLMEEVLANIKPMTQQVLDTNLKASGEFSVSGFIDHLLEVQVDSNDEEATFLSLTIHNLKAHRDITQHLAKVCQSNRDLVKKVWRRARFVAISTAILMHSCLYEPDTDLNFYLSLLLPMTDPTHPVASAFYFEIFNSMGFSHQIPFPDPDEMNFIDHLLLVIKNQIIQCQECQAIFVSEKLMACKTLVKAIVSYPPLSTKMILYGSIMKLATAILSFSFPIDSEEKNFDESFDGFLEGLVMSEEKNFYESFDGFLEDLVISGFIAHLLHYDNKSLKGQLEEFSKYITLLKAIVPYPPLRYLFSKIILHKVIVKIVTIVSSLSSSDTNMRNLVLPPMFEVATLIVKYQEFLVDVKDIHNLRQQYLKDIAVGEQKIGQYVDYLEEAQKQYLSSNKQAISSVQKLRSFQHISKVMVSWYNQMSLWNNLLSQLLIPMEHTTMFLCSCWMEPEKDNEFKTLEQFVSSPWKNVLAEASFIDHMLFYLKELIQCQTKSLVASLKEQLENLYGNLIALRNKIPVKDIVPSSRPLYIIPNRMRAFHSLVIKFVEIMETMSVNDSKDAEKESLSLLHDLEENVKLMKTELRTSFIFPSIGLIFKNLEEMLTFKSDIIGPMKHQFDNIKTGLLKLRSFLDKIKDKPIENKEHVKDLQQRIIQVSHRADFIIQSYVNRDVEDGPTYYYALQLSVIIEDIQLLIIEMEGHDTDTRSYVIEEESYKQGSSEGSTPNITDIVVGFQDESEDILKHLTGGSKDLNIIAIVGMPGIGKTTIAKKLYNHSSVAKRFDRCAWCCISQSYQKKELLLQILGSIAEVGDGRILETTDDEIAAMLSKGLKKRRYLIILDDVWESKVWEDLKRSFPDDKNHSRVIITSRNHDVAQTLIQATPYNYLHPLRLFNDMESFELLQKKLFPQGGLPTELSGAGMMIAKNCKGLPLSVVLAAGILSRMEKNEAHWIKFAESLSKQIVNEEGNQCKNLIELSYIHLPDHLKCCFLYFGAFPEDATISARRLTWLWIAEGFVRDVNPKRLEDIAEHYLMDLIGRSLVIGYKSFSRPGIKSCEVHDLLRDFCLAKAEEENFIQVVHDSTSHFDPENPQDPSKFTHRQYRLSIYSRKKHFVMEKPFGANVRTLFFHALDGKPLNHRLDASFISRYFKLINVLDLGSMNIGDSLTEVALMLHLRFLAVKGDIKSIPESIENLWKLQTFILEAIYLVYVPNSIWRLLKLRHLHIQSKFNSFNLESEGIANSVIYPDMESYSTPTISYGDDMEKLLRRLPNLRKLKCIFRNSWDDSEKCNRFPVLEFLTQLVSLKVSWRMKFGSRCKYPCRFSFPSSLTKLTLSEFRLPWSEISAIGKLPNLNSLKLLYQAFIGPRWDMREGEFVSLKFLQLERLDIEEWTATAEHIPCLERLMLSHCLHLKKVPSEIGDINTLELIYVRFCTTALAISATRIQETAEEYENYTLKVLTNGSW